MRPGIRNWKLGIMVIIPIVFFLSCMLKEKTVTLSELGLYRQDVQACMKALDVSTRPRLLVVEGSTVLCNGEKRRGCYQDGLITLPQHSDENTLKHELVHFYADKKYGYGNDTNHECMLDGENCYLKCGGLISE